MKGVTLTIDNNEESIDSPFCGMSDMTNGGTITFEPPAFTSREELARTIFHERLHIDQYREFGYTYVIKNYADFERITREAENAFAQRMREEGKLK